MPVSGSEPPNGVELAIKKLLMEASDFLVTQFSVYIQPGRAGLMATIRQGLENNRSLDDPQFVFNCLIPTVTKAREVKLADIIEEEERIAADAGLPSAEDMVHALLLSLHGKNYRDWLTNGVAIPPATLMRDIAHRHGIDMNVGAWVRHEPIFASTSSSRKGEWLANLRSSIASAVTQRKLVIAAVVLAGALLVALACWGLRGQVSFRAMVPALLALALGYLAYLVTKSKKIAAAVAAMPLLLYVPWSSVFGPSQGSQQAAAAPASAVEQESPAKTSAPLPSSGPGNEQAWKVVGDAINLAKRQSERADRAERAIDSLEDRVRQLERRDPPSPGGAAASPAAPAPQRPPARAAEAAKPAQRRGGQVKPPRGSVVFNEPTGRKTVCTDPLKASCKPATP
jgi:hypothetical protein